MFILHRFARPNPNHFLTFWLCVCLGVYLYNHTLFVKINIMARLCHNFNKINIFKVYFDNNFKLTCYVMYLPHFLSILYIKILFSFFSERVTISLLYCYSTKSFRVNFLLKITWGPDLIGFILQIYKMSTFS